MTAALLTPTIPCTTPTTVSIRIGEREQGYTLAETTAPCQYDYGGVIEVSRYADSRFLLIPTANVTTQLDRYRSGLYGATMSDVYDAGDVAKRVWVKLGPGGQG